MKALTALLVVLGTATSACRTTNPSTADASLREVDAKPPTKPNTIPPMDAKFSKNELRFINRNGNDVCADVLADFSKDPLPSDVDSTKAKLTLTLAKKLCDSEQKWVGFGVNDGLEKDSYTEFYYANFGALRALTVYAMQSGTPRGAIFMQYNYTLQLLDQERVLFAGETENSIMQEYNAKPAIRDHFDKFKLWVSQLTEWYTTH